ncbi:unnamed protein product, partial [Hapterophycus canaliculatus]
MSRAYRPRVSKDKAVAQRLQDLSTVRHTLDILESDHPIGTPPSTGAAEATAAGTIGIRLGLSPTPTQTRMPRECGSSRHRSRTSNCAKATPKMTKRNAKTRASDGASTAASAASPAAGAAGSASSASSTSSRSSWSCVSCSFFNVETAKKCSMCGTKNYQPRARTIVRSTPGPAGGTGVASNSEEDVRGEPEPRRRQSDGGPRERRSPRRSQQGHADPARPSIADHAREGQSKDRWGGVEDEAISVVCGTDAGMGDGGDSAGGSFSPAPRKRSRTGTLGRTTSAGVAGTGGAALPLPVEVAVPPAVATKGTTIRRSGKSGGTNAVVATPTTCEEEGEAADDTFGGGGGGARRALGAVGARHPNRGKPPPSSSSSSSCFRKDGRKRARAQSPADAGSEASAAAAASSSPPPVTVVTPASEAGSSSGPSPSVARKAPHEDQTTIPPYLVPAALTADSDRGLYGDPEACAPKATRRRRREGETWAAPEEDEASHRGPGVAPASPPWKRATASYADEEQEWPTAVSLISTLDFSGRPLLEVSSVVVTSPANRGAGNRPGPAIAASASIVVCHTGGVSVWDLTEEEAVCTCLSPSLLNATKEAVATRFFTAAVVGGDPAEVSRSATRAPGPAEAYILAIGRHETDPGFPIFRVWQQQQQQQQQQQKHQPLLPLPLQDEGRFRHGAGLGGGGGGVAVMRKNGASAASVTATPPAALTITLKKKFSKFFPPTVPSHIRPCLCVCNYSPPTAAAASAPEMTPGASCRGSPGAGSGAAGEITAVMALGGKALRLVFKSERGGPQEFRAKALPTGMAAVDAVFTSLAPVPSN